MIDVSRAGAVATIRLNRPDKLNALAGSMREDLAAAVRDADANRDCRVMVITGAGRAFCAGGDVEVMAGMQRAKDVAAFRKFLDAGRDVILAVAGAGKPVIAAINGIAAGAGCNLALACDYRIAADNVKLGETFVRIGLHPDWGGTWLLPRLVGRSRAFELMMSGRMVAADEALAIGMVDRVVPAADFTASVDALAQELAAAPPVAAAGIKRALAAAQRNDLAAQLDLETEHQLAAFSSADAAEGLAAFFEKRPPKF